jgi:hypothetical protein
MGPKKNPPPTPESMSHDDLVLKLTELTNTLASFSSRFDRLEKLWTEAKSENKILREALQEKEREIMNIRERMNDQEQYTRSWCIRVINMKLPQNDATEPHRVMQNVYDRLLLPILQGALSNKLIKSIPSVDQILETAHILPCKPGATPPIIARFYSRNIRALFFKLKKDFAPRSPPEPSNGARNREPSVGKLQFLLFEDLTRPTFNKMRALSQHEMVENCWSVSGALRFKLKNDTNIYKVKSVFSTVEQILASTKAK